MKANIEWIEEVAFIEAQGWRSFRAWVKKASRNGHWPLVVGAIQFAVWFLGGKSRLVRKENPKAAPKAVEEFRSYENPYPKIWGA